MPSFQDSAVIFFIALILFGPKKLPELARQLGKLMGEFRRASNEFRVQMEDELRTSEQAEKQKQIAAIEAAAPVTPVLAGSEANTIASPTVMETAQVTAQAVADAIDDPLDSHPHMPPPDRHTVYHTPNPSPEVTPLPIATSGALNLMPPATGLPASRSASVSDGSALSPIFDSIPEAPDRDYALQPEATLPIGTASGETVIHG